MMNKSLKVIGLVIFLSSCIQHNPDKVVDAIQKTDCKSISEIMISDGYIGGKLKIIEEQDMICEIYNLIKDRINFPDHDYLPLNQNIESVNFIIYNAKYETLFKVYTGKFNSKSGYIMVLDYKVNQWPNKKTVRDIEFPEKIISILN